MTEVKEKVSKLYEFNVCLLLKCLPNALNEITELE